MLLKRISGVAGSHALASIAQLFLLGFAARVFTTDDFATFLIINAAAWILNPIISLNSNESLSYFFPELGPSHSTDVLWSCIKRYFAVAFCLALLWSIISPHLYVSKFASFTPEVFSLCVITCTARVSFDAVYRFRSQYEKTSSSAWDYFIVMGLCPLVAMGVTWIVLPDIRAYYGLMVLATLLWSWRGLPTDRRFGTPRGDQINSRVSAAAFYSYGIKRVPVIIIASLILGMPVLIANGLKLTHSEVVLTGIAASFLRMLTMVGAVYTYTFIPKLRLSIVKQDGSVTVTTTKGLALALLIAFIATVTTYLFGYDLIHFFSALSEDGGAEQSAKILASTAFFVVMYSAMRPMIDALSESAYNVSAVTIGGLVFLISSLNSDSSSSIILSLGVSCFAIVLVQAVHICRLVTCAKNHSSLNTKAES